MKYSDFIEKMSQNAVGVAMRDSSTAFNSLRDDISQPDFLSDITEMESMEVIQG